AFGETLYLFPRWRRLFEKCATYVNLSISGERFGIPPNVYIILTSSSIDERVLYSIMPLFRVIYFQTPYSRLFEHIEDKQLAGALEKALKKINAGLGEGFKIDPWLFIREMKCSPKNQVQTVKEIFAEQVFPLIVLIGEKIANRIKDILKQGENILAQHSILSMDENAFVSFLEQIASDEEWRTSYQY
ncbi:MAG: hypothetical protein QXL15_04495, partial [Candidatus Korarchaeota archaeon]